MNPPDQPSVSSPLSPLRTRSDALAISRQREYFARSGFARDLLEGIPNPLLLLNREREIVFANQAGLDLLGVTEPDTVWGRRPGDALSCTQASACAEGCGGGSRCQDCGLVANLLGCLDAQETVNECRITRVREGLEEALDLRAWARPLQVGGEDFSLLVLADISHEKRRAALERVFFHDILNTIGSIRGITDLLNDYELDPAEQKEFLGLAQVAAQQAVEEIQGQRTLLAAETKELKVVWRTLDLGLFLREIVAIYRRHLRADGRTLVLDADCHGLEMTTDPALLRRVLGNMILNAFEAVNSGETVTIGGRLSRAERMEFWVHSPSFIPLEAQRQIFQRSFSTKGEGRGLGTYSLRLLSNYLGGSVYFSSLREAGTTFRAVYPLHPA